MRIFISVLGILSLVSCDTGDDGKQAESGMVSTDSGDATIDTENPDSPRDRDGDGFYDDCDDDNAAIYPGAAEVCDGLDNDCNGLVDDEPVDDVLFYEDADADGYGNANESAWSCEPPTGYVVNDLDCDDTSALFNPSAIEADCEDPNDYNCDGSVGYADADADGFAACAECDDSNADAHPDAVETCNGVDDNCNDLTDDEDPLLEGATTWYADADGDGHGGSRFTAEACDAPPAYVDNSDDCDDLEPLSYPSAAEICDEKDNDCDGDIDEGVGFTWYADVDGDGYGDASSAVTSCDAPQGYSANGNDCDDSAPSAHPGGVEICNGTDDDCDGTVDGASSLNASTFYADADGDGYGDGATSVTACEAPSNHVTNDDDCDDTSAAANPAADELCDGADNDCDGSVDEASAVDASTWYADADNDTYGNSAISQVACSAPSGQVADSSDCDDTNSGVHPTATETCNGTDDNCDGATDEGVLSTFYADFDSDTYGSPTISQEACTAPAAYVSDNTDCNDVDASINPGGTEICDSANDDEDCDGAADNADPEGATGTTMYYPDVDGDGYGDEADPGVAYCDNPGSLSTDNSDCDDTASGTAINPGATETWYDGVDSDCDGASDYDADQDGVDSVEHGGTDCQDDDSSSTADCYLYTFTAHDFTTCGYSGPTGPPLSECKSSYSTTGDWDEDSNYLDMQVTGIQRWTVPATAKYRITATGAAGQDNSNSYTGGPGATIQGEFDLTQGDIINILVGQRGTSNTTHGNENGGGGASFIVQQDGLTPLLVAGAGGGAPSHSYSGSCTRTNGDAQLGTSGKTVNCYAGAAGGSGGSGGSVGGNGTSAGGGCEHGAAGGGLTGDGANGGTHCSQSQGGDSFTNGGEGGQISTCYGTAHGGFGGGGTGNLGSPGGGGGYSGGGADGCWSSYADYGGGGGSYNNGSAQVNTSGTGTGEGSVTITLLSLN